jgi:hypothetical protein
MSNTKHLGNHSSTHGRSVINDVTTEHEKKRKPSIGQWV